MSLKIFAEDWKEGNALKHYTQSTFSNEPASAPEVNLESIEALEL